MMAEITDETNQARAYSLMPVAWALGATVGPLLGGYLSHPVERYPEWFGGNTFLVKYPYFLPCELQSLVRGTTGLRVACRLRRFACEPTGHHHRDCEYRLFFSESDF